MVTTIGLRVHSLTWVREQSLQPSSKTCPCDPSCIWAYLKVFRNNLLADRIDVLQGILGGREGLESLEPDSSTESLGV